MPRARAAGVREPLTVGVTGYGVQHFGYWAGFLGLSVVALIGIATLVWLFPEPKPGSARDWTRLLRMPRLLGGRS